MQPEIDVMIETEDGWARGPARYSIIDQGSLEASGLAITEVEAYIERHIADGSLLEGTDIRFHYSDNGHYYDTTARKFLTVPH